MRWFWKVLAAIFWILGALFILIAGLFWYDMYHQATGGEFDITFGESFFVVYISIFSALGALLLWFGIVANSRSRNQ